MAFHPAGMRQRGPQSPGALFTRPRESTRKFQEGHREASNLEQDALFLSPFLSCPSFPPSSGRGCHRRLEEKSKPLHWAESQKDQVWRDGSAGQMGKSTRQGLGRGGQPCGTGWREGQRQGESQVWAGSWAVSMDIDQANRHSWTLKTRAT